MKFTTFATLALAFAFGAQAAVDNCDFCRQQSSEYSCHLCAGEYNCDASICKTRTTPTPSAAVVSCDFCAQQESDYSCRLCAGEYNCDAAVICAPLSPSKK